MIGEIYEIKESNFDSILINGFWFPLQAVYPIYEEEKELEYAIKIIEKAGYKIIK